MIARLLRYLGVEFSTDPYAIRQGRKMINMIRRSR